jgi:hypothetical protein
MGIEYPPDSWEIYMEKGKRERRENTELINLIKKIEERTEGVLYLYDTRRHSGACDGAEIILAPNGYKVLRSKPDSLKGMTYWASYTGSDGESHNLLPDISANGNTLTKMHVISGWFVDGGPDNIVLGQQRDNSNHTYQVEVHIKAALQDGTYVYYEVSPTYEGIPPGLRDKVQNFHLWNPSKGRAEKQKDRWTNFIKNACPVRLDCRVVFIKTEADHYELAHMSESIPMNQL